MTLQRGDLVPHFEVRTTDGELFSYSAVWQRMNLVLIRLRATVSTSEDDYLRELRRHEAEFSERDSVCVTTRDEVPGLSAPGALIADRWGEIVYVLAAIHFENMPPARELLEWVEYVASRCPECEGEAR